MTFTNKKFPMWKRILDISLIALTAPITIPVGLIISLYIKLVSSGPIFFKQERIGMGCRPFLCYKFRSMKTNASTDSHQTHLKTLIQNNAPMHKIDTHDNRLILGAKILRSTGLDELPQLINVLKGEMSLVGPRPCLKYEFDFLKKTEYRRFSVLPGLTGLWQVSGKNNTTFREMILLDSLYAKESSILMDIRIMLSTFPMLLTQLLNNIK